MKHRRFLAFSCDLNCNVLLQIINNIKFVNDIGIVFIIVNVVTFLILLSAQQPSI